MPLGLEARENSLITLAEEGLLFLGFSGRITEDWEFPSSKLSPISPLLTLGGPLLKITYLTQKTLGGTVNSTDIALVIHRIKISFWFSAAIDNRLLSCSRWKSPISEFWVQKGRFEDVLLFPSISLHYHPSSTNRSCSCKYKTWRVHTLIVHPFFMDLFSSILLAFNFLGLFLSLSLLAGGFHCLAWSHRPFYFWWKESQENYGDKCSSFCFSRRKADLILYNDAACANIFS